MSKLKKIQIGIPCGPNSEHYVKHLIQSSNKTTSDPKRIEFLLAINDKSVDTDEILTVDTDSEIKIIDAINDNPISSHGHGLCLDLLFSNMTEDFGMIVDADVAFLAKSWDEKMLSLIHDDIVIIGSEYSGSKYLKFPNAICCLFRVKALQMCSSISFTPAKTRQITIDSTNARVFGRDPGDIIDLDVGWQLPFKIKIRGGDGIALPLINSNDERSKFMTAGMRGEEHQINGEPVFTHVGRSSYRNFHTDPIILRWRQRVDEWITKNA
jgi:hypothetical protein